MQKKFHNILSAYADEEKAETYRSFFKNSKGDVFLGIPKPIVRRLAKDHQKLPLSEILELMQSTTHEVRTLANEILRIRFEKGKALEQKEIFDFYLENRQWIRDWDAVDDTAPFILGPYLLKREKDPLYQLAKSERIWDRRIAMVSTLHFIRQGEFTDTLRLAEMYLNDPEDLIHKATGWMLREVGKKDCSQLKSFLDIHSQAMPRTMLRYAIERLTETERKAYLTK